MPRLWRFLAMTMSISIVAAASGTLARKVRLKPFSVCGYSGSLLIWAVYHLI